MLDLAKLNVNQLTCMKSAQQLPTYLQTSVYTSIQDPAPEMRGN